MIEYTILILAIPLGIIFARLTKNEKEIYSKVPYFPIILWILAIITTIFYNINKQIALTLTFIFITTLTWQRT
jgi:uncharacterized membrane protein